MSWYCRKPRPKTAPSLTPKTTSPTTIKKMRQLKESGPKDESKKSISGRSSS